MTDHDAELLAITEGVANYYAKQAQAVGFDENDKFISITEAVQALNRIVDEAVVAELERIRLLHGDIDLVDMEIRDRIQELRTKGEQHECIQI